MTYEIFEKLNDIKPPENNYIVFEADKKESYFGKNQNDDIVFMIQSKNESLNTIQQETKSLRFLFNKKCTILQDGIEKTAFMHMFICKEHNEDKEIAFIRLTYAFSFNDELIKDQFYLAKLFSSISSLFDKQKNVSEKELQGLFAELYTILYLHDMGCDVEKFWQSHNRMKFDFSLNEKKRLEVKSTLKPNRIHHFKQDQLLCNLYDIRIASLMLQKNDQGISLGDVITQIWDIYPESYMLLNHIEETIAYVEKDELYLIKYDKQYIDNKIRFYDAKLIPHFNEKTPEGIFNTEYDCDLEQAHYEKETSIKDWILEG